MCIHIHSGHGREKKILSMQSIHLAQRWEKKYQHASFEHWIYMYTHILKWGKEVRNWLQRSGKEFFYKEKWIGRRNWFSDKGILSRTEENIFFLLHLQTRSPCPQKGFVLLLLQLPTFSLNEQKIEERSKGSNFINSI